MNSCNESKRISNIEPIKYLTFVIRHTTPLINHLKTFNFHFLSISYWYRINSKSNQFTHSHTHTHTQTYLLNRVFFRKYSNNFGLILALDSSILVLRERPLELRLPLAKNTETVLRMVVLMFFEPPPPPAPLRPTLVPAALLPLLLLLTPWGVGPRLTPDDCDLFATAKEKGDEIVVNWKKPTLRVKL